MRSSKLKGLRKPLGGSPGGMRFMSKRKSLLFALPPLALAGAGAFFAVAAWDPFSDDSSETPEAPVGVSEARTTTTSATTTTVNPTTSNVMPNEVQVQPIGATAEQAADSSSSSTGLFDGDPVLIPVVIVIAAAGLAGLLAFGARRVVGRMADEKPRVRRR